MSDQQSWWHEDLSCFKFQYKFIKEKYNHLTDALNCNPVHLPNVKAEQEFNTHIMIPQEQVCSEPTLVALSTEQQDQLMELDLLSKVKLLQPHDAKYNHLVHLSTTTISPEAHYQTSAGILHFMGQVWVPEDSI
ncbi:hypothetical protein DSO57_1018423 [Entomophthora muscae]|uniref:Uncharacterized protein n=1 Tax=Entomophthora muscae TaxID=34485 RepID=A0ACC2TG74_9FUNG|nr:hypothetical protein DSO57_1018423 [Entomophthora muscae]